MEHTPTKQHPTPRVTPIKVTTGRCVACAEEYNKKRAVKVNRKSADGTECSHLLMKFGEVNVTEGSLCVRCVTQLKQLHKLDQELDKSKKDFKEKCARSHVRLRPKRLRDTPDRVALRPVQPPASPVHVQPQSSIKVLFPQQQLHSEQRVPMHPGAIPKRSHPQSSVKSLFSTKRIAPKPPAGGPAGGAMPTTPATLKIEEVIASNSTATESALTLKESRKLIKAAREGSTRNVTEVVMTELGAKFIPHMTAKLMNTNDTNIPGGVTIERSVLRKPKEERTMDHLKSLKWQDICAEAFKLFPMLISMMISIMLPKDKWGKSKAIKEILPRLGMIYAIIMQARLQQLSRVQNVMTALLANSICESKIYSRLQRVGICNTHWTGTRLLDAIKGGYHKRVVEAVKKGHHIRIIGDNIDFSIGVRDERKLHHGKLHHYFGSAFLINEFNFKTLPGQSPQKVHTTITPADLLPSKQDEIQIMDDYINIVVDVAKELEAFKFMNELTSKKGSPIGPSKTTPVPLPALHRNEQEYNDVCEILRFYESLLAYIYDEANMELTDDVKVQVGGDQLTRERFCGAKRLVVGQYHEPAERFDHLEPISFEFFHLSMKYLGICFKRLFHEESSRELGTMKAEATRTGRTQLKKDVTKAYTPDKEFFVMFVDCYIVEALCDHFQLTDRHQKELPNAPADLDDRTKWVKKEIRCLVEGMVGTFSFKTGLSGPKPTQVRLPNPASMSSQVPVRVPTATSSVPQPTQVRLPTPASMSSQLPVRVPTTASAPQPTQVRLPIPGSMLSRLPVRVPTTASAPQPTQVILPIPASLSSRLPVRVPTTASAPQPTQVRLPTPASMSSQLPVRVPTTASAPQPTQVRLPIPGSMLSRLPVRVPTTASAPQPTQVRLPTPASVSSRLPVRVTIPASTPMLTHFRQQTSASLSTQVRLPVLVSAPQPIQVRRVRISTPASMSSQVPVRVPTTASAPQPTQVRLPTPASMSSQLPVKVPITASAPQPTQVRLPTPASMSSQLPVRVPTTASAPQPTQVRLPTPASMSSQLPVRVPTAASAPQPSQVGLPTPASMSSQLPVRVPTAASSVNIYPEYIQIKLPNGKLLQIKLVTQPQKPAPTQQPPPPPPDKIQCYAHHVLELGLLFKNFDAVCAMPDRKCMLRTLKFMMLFIRADNPQAKYADEILRFLMQQEVLLSERAANEMFYSLFVNLKGHQASSMPADLWMEGLVRTSKKHIKSMVSNKNEKNIFRRTAALAGLSDIAANYDVNSSVPVQQTKHTKATLEDDKKIVIDDLRAVRPFRQTSGRNYSSFPKVERSVLANLNYTDLHAWMSRRIKTHGTSLAV